MATGKLKEHLKQIIPQPVYPLSRFIYRKVFVNAYFKGIEATDLIFMRKYEGKKLPPASLRFQVQMSPKGRTFARIGRRVSASLIETFSKAGKSPSSITDILDFGCGCGRTLIWIKDELPNARICGTDIDGPVIDWCNKNFKFGSFSTNGPVPPLKYEDESFDAIYAISVFTHFSEEMQEQWLKELARITKPGAVVLLSLLGPTSWDKVPEPYLSQAKENGFLYIDPKGEDNLFPDWRHVTLHTPEYVKKTFSRYFEVLDYLPQKINRHQDLAVLKKPEG